MKGRSASEGSEAVSERSGAALPSSMEVSNLGEHTGSTREPCAAPFASTGYHPRGFLGPFLRPGPEKWMELDPECDSGLTERVPAPEGAT